MAAARDESKVVTPFMPSLLHCSAVKIAVPLFDEFGVQTLEGAFMEIQQGNSTTSEENSTESRRAKESLLYIPSHLRQIVMEAVHGSLGAITKWKTHHYRFQMETHNLSWRSDGSIDTVKTAQHLVLDEKFDIRDRFELACKYCLVKSVQALWEEMVNSGVAESFRASHEGMASFWVKWLCEEPRVSWTESLMRSLENWMPRTPGMPVTQLPRFSALLPYLRPEQRKNCLHLFKGTSSDDLRFCLYALTKEEEKQVFMNSWMVFRLLNQHLEWPLQTLFLETAERLWNYIDKEVFRYVLLHILDLNDILKDFNYSELFDRFWNASPLYLRESARELSGLRVRIDSFFDERKKKLKLH